VILKRDDIRACYSAKLARGSICRPLGVELFFEMPTLTFLKLDKLDIVKPIALGYN
jgi:hypothetical protein